MVTDTVGIILIGLATGGMFGLILQKFQNFLARRAKNPAYCKHCVYSVEVFRGYKPLACTHPALAKRTIEALSENWDSESMMQADCTKERSKPFGTCGEAGKLYIPKVGVVA